MLRAATLDSVQEVMGGDEIVLLVLVATFEDMDPVGLAVLAVEDLESDAVCELDEEFVELEP